MYNISGEEIPDFIH